MKHYISTFSIKFTTCPDAELVSFRCTCRLCFLLAASNGFLPPQVLRMGRVYFPFDTVGGIFYCVPICSRPRKFCYMLKI